MIMKTEELQKKLLTKIEQLKAPEGYLTAGYPNYDSLFGRDSLIAAWQMLKINSEIAKSTLQILATYQGKKITEKGEEEPGKILHEGPEITPRKIPLTEYWDFPYYGTADATLWFVIVAKMYFQETKDKQFIAEIWNNIVAAVEWISEYGDKDNDAFVEYERKNPKGLFHQGWRDSFSNHLKINPPVAIVEVQGYTYLAYQSAIALAETLGEKEFIPGWQQKAEKLHKRFHEAFWWKEEEYYVLALNGDKTQRKSVSSNPGHLLFCGITSKEATEKVVHRLFQPDMLTPFGIRTMSEKDPDFDASSYHLGSVWPHDNWIIYEGLKKQGFEKEAETIKQSLLKVYEVFNCIPELFEVRNKKIISLSKGALQQQGTLEENIIQANNLQAWSTCGLLNMIS